MDLHGLEPTPSMDSSHPSVRRGSFLKRVFCRMQRMWMFCDYALRTVLPGTPKSAFISHWLQSDQVRHRSVGSDTLTAMSKDWPTPTWSGRRRINLMLVLNLRCLIRQSLLKEIITTS